MFEHIMRSIGDSVGLWLYLIAGSLCFAEAAILVGMVLPGETALLVAGVFCNAKYGHLNLKKFGPPLRRSRLGQWVGEHRWAKVDGFLHRHGGKAVLLGRLTAVLRALMPSMAGMSGMRYRTFLLWNAIGGLIWAPGCVLLGYAFASALDVVGQTLTWAPLAILAVAVVVYLGIHLRKRRVERAEAAAFAESDAAAATPKT
jgi:membrane protein DedA with SNARE-associated domain